MANHFTIPAILLDLTEDCDLPEGIEHTRQVTDRALVLLADVDRHVALGQGIYGGGSR